VPACDCDVTVTNPPIMSFINSPTKADKDIPRSATGRIHVIAQCIPCSLPTLILRLTPIAPCRDRKLATALSPNVIQLLTGSIKIRSRQSQILIYPEQFAGRNRPCRHMPSALSHPNTPPWQTQRQTAISLTSTNRERGSCL
jgi:hypothetical protein